MTNTPDESSKYIKFDINTQENTNEEYNFNYYHDNTMEIISTINVEDHPYDKELVGLTLNLVTELARVKFRKKESNMLLNELRILIYEIYNGDKNHKDHKRKDGSSYFRTHCISTTLNIISDTAVTDIETIIAALKHDDIEDLGISRKNIFLPTTNLDISSRLKNIIADTRSKIHSPIGNLIEGVTKVTDIDKDKSKIETLMKFFDSIRRHGIRVAIIKASDRRHNISTISGHKNRSKQLRIINDTLRIYLPLTKLLKLDITYEKLLHDCLEEINPVLIEEYSKYMKKHERKFTRKLQKIKTKIEEFALENNITNLSIQYQSIPISHYIPEKKFSIEKLEKLTINDINLDEANIRSQIFIVCKNNKDKQKIISGMPTALSRRFECSYDDIGNEDIESVIITLFSNEIDEQLKFVINTEENFEKSKNGLLNHKGKKTKKFLEDKFRQLLWLSQVREEPMKAFESELIPKITVYGPRNQEFNLNKGSSVLDFITIYNPNYLKHNCNIKIYSQTRGTVVNVGLFEELLEGETIIIDRQENELQTLNASYYLYMQGQSEKSYKKFIKKTEKAEQINIGEKYLDDIGKFFNLIPEITTKGIKNQYYQEIYKYFAIYKNRNQSKTVKELNQKVEEFKIELSKGKYNILIFIAEILKDKHNWEFIVKFEDKPGEYRSFLDTVSSDEINITKNQINLKESNYASFTFEDILKREPQYELLHKIFSGSYKFDIKLKSPYYKIEDGKYTLKLR